MKRIISATILLITTCFATKSATPQHNRWGASYFPGVTLTTQEGKAVNFYDDLIKGKIVVIDLIYTRCKDSCPLETARLRQVQKILGDRVGKDIFFYSISIDPTHDTPEVLRDYSEMYNAGPGWTFLTGKKEDIDLISKKLGLYSEPNPANRDGHTPHVLIGNEPTGQWMRQSAGDNPSFLSMLIGEMLDNYKHTQHDPKTRYSQAPTLELDKGRYLFGHECAACHTVGHGDKIGPDLFGVTNVRDQKWLHEFISAPDKFLDRNDPIASALYEKYKHVRMPNLRLPDVDVTALIEFLSHASAPDRVTQFTTVDPKQPLESQ